MLAGGILALPRPDNSSGVVHLNLASTWGGKTDGNLTDSVIFQYPNMLVRFIIQLWTMFIDRTVSKWFWKILYYSRNLCKLLESICHLICFCKKSRHSIPRKNINCHSDVYVSIHQNRPRQKGSLKAFVPGILPVSSILLIFEEKCLVPNLNTENDI